MPESRRQILVTSALPYANGSIHLGHLVEYIQTDIWVRYQKTRGHDCIYVCADDAHGTPIMLRAQQENVEPEVLITRFHEEHLRDFGDFAIRFDNYHTTHSIENRELANLIYSRLQRAGHIETRVIKQAYDPLKEMFLPDRFIKGECPRCGAADQYGDSCEVCGATYSPLELKNPLSAISGAQPVERESEHYFFRLTDFENMLKKWTASGHLQEQVSNKLDEWFEVGLQAWDISRDAPYFGFEIPDHPGKYFYVWLDAPIGYMASFRNLCDRSGCDFDEYWQTGSQAELYHFIGKDIVYFHALFWPAMLEGAGFRKPTAIFAHGFLTVNGQKMSKSRGTFIRARTYLDHLNPEYLRYYFAAKLNNRIDDIDLNLEDFVSRVNADLIGKLVNIASRCSVFINRKFNDTLASECCDAALYDEFVTAGEAIGAAFEAREYGRAIREIMRLADQANRYIDEKQPWILAKQADKADYVHQICSLGINLFRLLILYLQPVLPVTAGKTMQFLNIASLDWEQRKIPLRSHRIKAYSPLLTRVDKEAITAMLQVTADELNRVEKTPMKDEQQADTSLPADEPICAPVSYEDFARIDLRIGRIIEAENVSGADKLLRLTIDLGSETRNILAGIKTAYQPEALVGRLTVVVANLTPRKMRFGVSEGMVLAAGTGGQDLWLLHPDTGARPGMRVR